MTSIGLQPVEDTNIGGPKFSISEDPYPLDLAAKLHSYW